jgi:hypothetical protein
MAVGARGRDRRLSAAIRTLASTRPGENCLVSAEFRLRSRHDRPGAGVRQGLGGGVGGEARQRLGAPRGDTHAPDVIGIACSASTPRALDAVRIEHTHTLPGL